MMRGEEKRGEKMERVGLRAIKEQKTRRNIYSTGIYKAKLYTLN